ncbi:MAG: hypothetical protein PWQ55_1102 [Chloroflexota bacterium]|nr:hypothetical protein [Chloroflexota bacterium]
MPVFIYILLGVLLLFIIIFLVWRLASDNHSLPCPAWLGWMVELDNPIFRNDSAKVIVSHLDLQPGMQVLDYGCGPGRLSLPMARVLAPQGRVTAVDLQAEMLARVRAKAEAEQLDNITYVQADPQGAHLPDDTYDCAILVTVLGEILDQQRALREVYAVLKPGGMLSITEVIADPHFQSREKVLDLARAAGFEEQARFGGRWSYTLNFRKP